MPVGECGEDEAKTTRPTLWTRRCWSMSVANPNKVGGATYQNSTVVRTVRTVRYSMCQRPGADTTAGDEVTKYGLPLKTPSGS